MEGGAEGSTAVRGSHLSHLPEADGFDVVPTALGPLAEVRGGDDQIQRGAGGLPRTQQRADPAAA